MSKKVYKSLKKIKCPYCEYRDTRSKLEGHIDRNHKELIPENYTSNRVIYEYLYKKDHGTCMECKNPTHEWDERLGRYKNLCNNPACREAVRKKALQNHIKIYKVPTLLNNPEHQEKMLAHRRISGKYKFRDGGIVTYTGNYEKNLLEFMDNVLYIPSKDIQSPGPVLEYTYNGEKHFWITDIYYIPANLLIEVKDGGSNPNKKNMKDSRDKQLSKEKMITDAGIYNYLRLTDNNFLQLLEILTDIKYDIVEARPLKIKINEYAGLANGPTSGIPPANATTSYIIPTLMKNSFNSNDIKLVYTDTSLDNTGYVFDSFEGGCKEIDIDDAISNSNILFKYNDEINKDKLNKIIEDNGTAYDLIEIFLNHKPMCLDEICFSNKFEMLKINHIKEKPDILTESITNSIQNISNLNKIHEMNNKILELKQNSTCGGIYTLNENLYNLQMSSEYNRRNHNES